jgi:hypothetical protein
MYIVEQVFSFNSLHFQIYTEILTTENSVSGFDVEAWFWPGTNIIGTSINFD